MCETLSRADRRSVDRVIAVARWRLDFERRARGTCCSDKGESEFGGCASARGMTSSRLQATRGRWWRMRIINKHQTGTSAGSALGPADWGHWRTAADIAERMLLIRSVELILDGGLAVGPSAASGRLSGFDAPKPGQPPGQRAWKSWIEYTSGVLGFLRVERDNLKKMLADKDVLGIEGIATCSICQEIVNLGEEVAQLDSCKHWYHDQCIGYWLDGHAECPLCRGSSRSSS